MKQVFILIAVLTTIVGCSSATSQGKSSASQDSGTVQQLSPAKDKQLSEQEKIIAAQKAKEDFISEFKVPEANVGEPLLYDLNNDAQDEIIVCTIKKTVMDKADVYVSVYNLQTGAKSASRKFDDNGSAVSVFKINNPSYKKALAVVMYGNGGYGSEIITVQKNAIVSVGNVTSQYGDPDVVTDVDKDGYHEFKGFEHDYGIGSDRVPDVASFINEIIFKWDEKSKKYMASAFGEDGLMDTQRNEVSELTVENALQILQAAYKLQLSWTEPKSEQEARKFMRPFFSNNFVYEFLNDNMRGSPSKGIIPRYSESDDTRWLLPEYTKQTTDLQFSQDKTMATVNQLIQRSFEGESYMRKVSTLLVKTKYGWKIDSFKHEKTDK
ncbi:hypothetical protein [Paenibacillus validus]|uniref:hypothetical protein n=1 Tax=Paenibacillus validus TaxID=44253 RepID=UPI003D2C316A